MYICKTCIYNDRFIVKCLLILQHLIWYKTKANDYIKFLLHDYYTQILVRGGGL